MSKVIFQIEGGAPVVMEANVGDNLLELARRANVAIDAPCSGNGSCGKCRVKLLEGELEGGKTRHISEAEYAEGWRLSCACTVSGDVTVLVPDIASAYQSRMKTADLSTGKEVAIFEALQADLRQSGISFDNTFRAVELILDAPTLDDTMPDNERISWALREKLGVSHVEEPYEVMVKLAHTLRENSFHITAKGELQGDTFYLMDVTSPEDRDLIGCAIDIGTTTVSMVLVDLNSGKILAKGSSGNGQIRYGADVINRIIESGRPGGRKRLQDAVIKESIIPMLAFMYRTANINPRRIYRMVLAGNTTMNHLLLGLYADPIRMEPFVPSFFHTDHLFVRDIQLKMNPLAELIVAPNIGSYVGGDITAGALVSMIWNNPEMSLFIDLGTNGELVFGNSEFLMSCACSAGPAFEGGDISCGMRATDGAVEACTIDKETMEPTMTVVGGVAPAGICGSGIIDIIAELFRCGIINGKGKFVREGARVLHDEHGMGSYVLAWKKDTGGVKDVVINEVDIDNFIRAKGAIFSATQTMLRSLGFDTSVIERVYVAGGIGSGINMRNAVTIGMFPDIPLENFHYIGNSSQAGAYAMLLSSQAREKVFELGRSMTYLELSNEPGYMDEFVAACFLPHTDAGLFPSVEL